MVITMVQLERVVNGSVDIGTFMDLNGFVKLKDIRLRSIGEDDLLNGVGNLTSLSYLDVSYNYLNNLYDLYKNVNMETLFLDSNSISDLTCVNENGETVSAFCRMSHLNNLSLSHNNIEDLSPLECLLNFKGEDGKIVLKKLNLKANSFERISISGTNNEEIINKFISAGCSVSYDAFTN